jgi:hypothetical protein
MKVILKVIVSILLMWVWWFLSFFFITNESPRSDWWRFPALVTNMVVSITIGYYLFEKIDKINVE